MKKIIAAAVASVFAFASFSSFAGDSVKDQRFQSPAPHSAAAKKHKAKGAKFHSVKLTKKAKKHHRVKRSHRSA